MKILIASDHAGLEFKEELMLCLQKLDYEIEDKGPFEYHSEDDYPDFVAPVARAVSQNSRHLRAIIIGGTGQGEAMLANRFKNVRATVYCSDNLNIIRLSREHNDANILCLGARVIGPGLALEIVRTWLHTDFAGGRHQTRIDKF